MYQKVKCTHCYSLLKNLKPYAEANFFFKNNEIFMWIDNISEMIIIEDIEMYQEATFKAYQRLITLLEKEA